MFGLDQEQRNFSPVRFRDTSSRGSDIHKEISHHSETHPVKFVRYRRPSWKTILGITQAKKRINKELGITAAIKPLGAWTNAKRRFKRGLGYESEAGRLSRDGLPRAVDGVLWTADGAE